jgi:AhpD family alkylhydroperoxidase
MKTRINVIEKLPQATKALYALSAYVESTPLTKTHKELLKIRASQINGCAFCIDMHTKDALKYEKHNSAFSCLMPGKKPSYLQMRKKLFWQYEEVTLISRHGITDATYTLAKSFFTDEYIAQLIVAAVTINAWNRLAVSSKLEPADV